MLGELGLLSLHGEVVEDDGNGDGAVGFVDDVTWRFVSCLSFAEGRLAFPAGSLTASESSLPFWVLLRLLAFWLGLANEAAGVGSPVQRRSYGRRCSMVQRCIVYGDVQLIKELQKFNATSSKGSASSFTWRIPPETRKTSWR